MAKLLLGKEVTAALNETLRSRTAALAEKNLTAKLAIVRCGENPSDIAYEKGALTRSGALGVAVERTVLPQEVTEDALLSVIDRINADATIHGCLLLRPLPVQLRDAQDRICSRLLPCKDADGMTDLSAAGVFEGKPLGYAPCTAQACMEILTHYGIDCAGRHAVVIGRSLVVGRPLAMLLLGRDATVTLCHSKTGNLSELARSADILISAVGQLGSLTRDFVRPGQIVLDVSVNWDARKPNARGGLGAIAGDAVFDEVEPIVDAITPAPGGVGAVTTSVLLSHVIESAERSAAQ